MNYDEEDGDDDEKNMCYKVFFSWWLEDVKIISLGIMEGTLEWNQSSWYCSIALKSSESEADFMQSGR